MRVCATMRLAYAHKNSLLGRSSAFASATRSAAFRAARKSLTSFLLHATRREMIKYPLRSKRLAGTRLVKELLNGVDGVSLAR
jgi:hypothetical protein